MSDYSKVMFGRVAIAISVAIFLVFAAIEIYFFLLKPRMGGEVTGVVPTPREVMPVRDTPPPTPIAESVAPINSLIIDTNYKEYFAASDKCHQSYNEMFGNNSGAFSDNSACNATVTFNRDGSSEKLIVIRKYDPQARQWKEVERNRQIGQAAPEDFEKLVTAVTTNEAFKSWNNNISITARNTMITAKYADGFSKSPMSNVDARTTVFLAMMDAFKELDGKTKWK